MNRDLLECKKKAKELVASENPGGGGTPLYGLYRYVPRNRVWFLEVLDP